MRVRIKRNPGLNTESSVDSSAAASDTEVVDVPAKPFITVAGVSALVTTLLTLLTFWLVTKPDADVKRDMDVGVAQMERLERAMQVEDAKGRAASLRLMSAMGLLEVRNPARMDSVLRSVDSLPRWPAAAPRQPRPEAAEDSSAKKTETRIGTGTGTGTGTRNAGSRSSTP